LGHLRKGGHIRGGLSICSFGITQSPVGRFANFFHGTPVLGTDAPSNSEVLRIADHRLGAEGFTLLEVLFESRRFVIATQCWIHTFGQHARAKCSWSGPPDRTIKNQCNLMRTADVEMIPNHAFKPDSPRLWSVKYTRVGNLELAKGQFVDVSGSHIGGCER
jgi:hypothetical protein